MNEHGIAAMLPLSATDFGVRLALIAPIESVCSLLATFDSIVFDYCSRVALGGTHLSDYIMRQLPVSTPKMLRERPAWTELPYETWINSRVPELSYTANDLRYFAQDVGYHGPPFRFDPERRFLLRAELDAAFFHLYGIDYDDAAYIMDTFPIVRRKDEAHDGEYRTKRVILECYDAMADAAAAGVEYATVLDPPPADPRVAHPITEEDRPADEMPQPLRGSAASPPRSATALLNGRT